MHVLRSLEFYNGHKLCGSDVGFRMSASLEKGIGNMSNGILYRYTIRKAGIWFVKRAGIDRTWSSGSPRSSQTKIRENIPSGLEAAGKCLNAKS